MCEFVFIVYELAQNKTLGLKTSDYLRFGAYERISSVIMVSMGIEYTN